MKYKYITAEAKAVEDELVAKQQALDHEHDAVVEVFPDVSEDFRGEKELAIGVAAAGASPDVEKFVFASDVKVVIPATNTVSPAAAGMLQLSKARLIFTRSTEELQLNPAQSSALKKCDMSACQPFPSSQWSTRDIHDALMRNYNLLPVAVEVFFSNRTAVFFEFESSELANAFLSVLRSKVRPPYILPHLGRKPMSIMQKTMYGSASQHLTTAWMNREITNFEYLMKLNTIAGRTFNDLGQYPVFPWILANYVSPELDLRDPLNYRDLRYPVGAQTPENRALVASKYQELEKQYNAAMNMSAEGGYDDPGALPPFHFGSHYSVAGFVLWYLMRLEPYTSLHIQLQDGRFDKPDRMFTSLAATWRGCTTNTSDVKELIPEMFYCPELLTNVNNIDFGKTQAGKRVSEVQLPPWANNSIHEFIYQHREALESEFVSLNLHHWIDLIFGYKQRPPHLGGHPDAVESCNIFFHLTYANAVDLETLKKSDPTLYYQYVCQIAEFGQTPAQLFDKPHPPRPPLQAVDIIWPIASVVRGVDTVTKEKYLPVMPKKVVCKKGSPVSINPLLMIVEFPGDKLITVDTNRIVGHHFWQVVSPDVVPPFKFKVDEVALEISQGYAFAAKCFDGVLVERLLALCRKFDKRQRYVEKRLGVPFAAPTQASNTYSDPTKPMSQVDFYSFLDCSY
jgi:hypothetical protein